MLDRPDAAQLLKAMSTTLSEEVMPTTSGATRHSVRVVANLCKILAREVTLGGTASDETRKELTLLLERDGSLRELVAELDRRLRDPEPAFEASARVILRKDVERRLAINRPGYGS